MRLLFLSYLLLALTSTQVFSQTSPTPDEEQAQSPAEVVAADAASEVNPAPELNPAYDMLQQAYHLGGQLPTDENTYLMGRLVSAASKMRHPMLRQWVNEVFQLTAGLPQRGSMRQEIEQSALRTLAEVDPAEALRMLGQLAPPAIASVQHSGQAWDRRTSVAREIFPKYWRDVEVHEVEALRIAASQLGETGEYPFAALGTILQDISEKDALSPEMLFLDAVQYFRREQLNRTQVHGEFLGLLQMAREVISDALIRSAVALAANRLLEDAEIPMPEDMDFISRVFTSDGYVEQRSFADQVLYKILPLVREFAPELEERILERRAGLTTVVPTEFGPALEGYSENAISIMPSTADPSERARVLQSIIDQSRARKAQGLADLNPETARRLASTIEDAGLRATTLIAIGQAGLNEDSPIQGVPMRDASQSSSLEEVPEDENEQLRLLLRTVRAQARSDDPELWGTLVRGLELAEELFMKEFQAAERQVGYRIGPDWDGPEYGASGFQEANTLLRIGIEKQTANTLGWLAQQHGSELKSYLLIAAAEVLWNQQNPAGASPENRTAVKEETISIR